MPKNNEEYTVNWRKNIADMITGMQEVVDASSKKQIEKKFLHYFGNHHSQENLIEHSMSILRE